VPGVVLLVINLAADTVLLAVNLALFFIGEIAAVLSTVVTDFAVETGFLVLQVRRFPGRELARLHALGDTILLVLLARLNLRVQTGDHQSSGDQRGKGKAFHFSKPSCVSKGGMGREVAG